MIPAPCIVVTIYGDLTGARALPMVDRLARVAEPGDLAVCIHDPPGNDEVGLALAVREILGRIPAATLVAEAIDLDGGLVYLSSRAWDVDGATLAGVWAHERGHHLRDKAARAAAGVVGSALWGGAYLVHPTIRGWEEGTCYTCDVAARVILAGDDPDAVARGALVSLRGYDLDAQGEAIASAAIRSAAASLKAGALPGVGTPLHETLRALRAKGASFGRWDDVIDAEAA